MRLMYSLGFAAALFAAALLVGGLAALVYHYHIAAPVEQSLIELRRWSDEYSVQIESIKGAEGQRTSRDSED